MNEKNQQPSIARNQLKMILKDQRKDFEKKDLGIEREELTRVSKYLRLPYVIVFSGLRRVGKSTLLAQIARKFYPGGYYFVNFEDERLLNFSAADFDLLHEVLVELFAEQDIFFFDEIQNVPGWERFVRRMVDKGYKLYLTGSNASLFSQELGTKLTGRYLPIELLPFSFREFLAFKETPLPKTQILTPIERGRLKRNFNQYLSKGGIPDALKYPDSSWPKVLYEDVIFRDVAARYQITEVRALKELSFYLISNVSRLISYNKVKELLKLGSVNTVKNYVDYLETAWLFLVVNRYSYSVKTQQIAPKKIYGIDTGMVRGVGFSFSENRGILLENLVYLSLRRSTKECYYYKCANNLEVDFYLPEKRLLIQVAQNLEDKKTKEREMEGLKRAAEELKIKKGFILTDDEKGAIKKGGLIITIKPIYEWLLET